ncbi:mucin TcMUCII [Trypanosoma cruzi cruzi]|uniref:Putative mucin TcMUCII n=1 Tax=Trypanosoma cruzi TaxID=5693 RepID=A0A2V2VUV0_TRYCR|nr:mucin TcMUCII [Trypanosoma cruzi cruzi]PWU99894.1 putative mucin TcMUCII [Trypanosoma cruzi]
MMTTCRLLYALLLLALCCCPSVCVTEPQLEDTGNLVEEERDIQLPPSPQTPAQKGEGSDAENGNAAGKGGGKTTALAQSSATPNKVQEKSTEETFGTKSATRTSTEQAIKNVDDFTEETTTTTTTKAPTTTTTTTTQAPTTTTTAAPEAPSTTTTEAPAVSTTHAPSRLREVDGSLSSSAWVCAPLVLAASALAYTTVD